MTLYSNYGGRIFALMLWEGKHISDDWEMGFINGWTVCWLILLLLMSDNGIWWRIVSTYSLEALVTACTHFIVKQVTIVPIDNNTFESNSAFDCSMLFPNYTSGKVSVL